MFLGLMRLRYVNNLPIKGRKFSPRKSSPFHVVGERDVIGPDVELPLPQTENSAVNSAGVNAHAHVHVHAGHLADESETNNLEIVFNVHFIVCIFVAIYI